LAGALQDMLGFCVRTRTAMRVPAAQGWAPTDLLMLSLNVCLNRRCRVPSAVSTQKWVLKMLASLAP
jgi:hypothetical protein